MNEDTKPEISKAPWYTRLFKWVFFISAFVLIMLTVLANIGGNGEFYKESIESYVRGATGYHARVETLNNVSFFPSIEFDFEGLTLHQNLEEEVPVGGLASARFRAGFWDVMFKTGKIKTLELRGFSALPSVFTNKALQIESVTIDENYLDESPQAALLLKGKIGDDTLAVRMNLDVFGQGQGKKYRFSTASGFEGSVGALRLSGAVKDGVFEQLTLALGDKPVITGKLALKRKAASELVVQGEWEVSEHQTQIKHNLVFITGEHGRGLKGDIQSAAFHMSDFGKDSQLQALIAAYEAVLGEGKKSFTLPLAFMDVDARFEHFMLGKADLGDLTLTAKIVDQALSLTADEPFAFSDAHVNIALKALEDGPELDVNITLKDFDYGALQKKFNEQAEVSGTAEVILALRGQAADLSGLTSSLNGKFTFIGGEGKLRTDLINLWGGGLVNAILPDTQPLERTQVNCAIMDFTIKDGLASSNALFMDTGRLTLAGEGSYDLTKDDLNITLTPKPKDVALGDIAASVKIRGPLGSPSIGPDLRGIGRKIGGLLLGAVNPVFLAYSLTDLGLNEDHPCAAYMAAEEEVREVPAVGRGEAGE